MHVCISVHTTKMTAILEKVSILNILLAIQFFQKVALTEAYILYHYCGNEHRTGMAVILKNGFHPEFLLATSQWPFLSVDCTLPWWRGLCTPMNLRAMPAGILYPWQV